MKMILYVIVLAFVLNACKDNSSSEVKVTTDEDGNTIYEAKVGDGKPVGIVSREKDMNSLKEVSSMGDYIVGQVWTYKTREGEEKSRVTILRLEENEKIGGIIHVSLNGLKIKNSSSPESYTNEAGHLPFSVNAIRKSVIELESIIEVDSGYMEGYQMWRKAFEQGNAGVFTTSLIEGVNYLEKTFKQANTQPGASH